MNLNSLKAHRLSSSAVIRAAGLLISLCLFNSVVLCQSTATVFGDLTLSKNRKSKSFSMRYVYADGRGVAGRKEPDTDLVFTDQPVPEDRLERIQYIRVMAAEGKLHALSVTIDNDKKVSQSVVDTDSFGTTSSDDDEQVFEAETFDGKIIAGKVKSLGFVSGDSEAIQWQYDVTFRVTIKTRSLELVELPAGGGAPGKAYAEFYNAVQVGNLQAFKSLLASETARAYDEPEAQKKLAKLKAVMKPWNKIRDGSSLFASGKSAWLMLENAASNSSADAPPRTIPGPPPALVGTVHIPPDARMVLEGGQWKVAWVTWGPENFNRIVHPERP